MELKINVQIPEKECLVMDSTTGEIYKTTVEKLIQTQKELNDLVCKKGRPISIHEVYEIMTKDWPEDKKVQFFENLNKHCGWGTINKDKFEEFELNGILTDDSELLVRWNYN
jgi:hypothetical protein